jgi:LysM repeat protein
MRVTRWSRLALVALLVIGFSLLATACGLIGDDDSGPQGATVGAIVFSSDTNAQGQQINFRNFFAPNDGEIVAVVSLADAKAGTKITGRWFTLGFGETPPDGLEINHSDVVLKPEQITAEGRSAVTFTQRAGGSGFPEIPWVLRIYVDDQLARTAGFIVTRAVTGATAAPTPGPPAPAPTPVSYTVVAGDTLQSVAQRFLPPGGNLQAFMASLASFNNLQPTATLQAGQVLRIPPP